jgi:microcystin-dependent protein
MADEKTTSGCEPEDAPAIMAAVPPTLAITQLLDTGGTMPVYWPPQPPDANYVRAMVHSFGGDFSAYRAPPCLGQQVNLSNNAELFEIVSNFYGGDGETNFDLPDLRGRVAAGGPQVGAVSDGSLAMTYMIAADIPSWGAFPMYGMIGLFAGPRVPSGWLAADGSRVSAGDYYGLYQAIGSAFGGDGQGNFNLPYLQGRAAIGAGAGPGRAPVTLGEVVDNGASGMVPALGLTYLINVAGNYPGHDGDGGFPQNETTLGEIVAFAGSGLPVEWPGWALCDGSLLPIHGNDALFSLLRTTFGGDGTSNFALPDLRGRMIVGSAG